LATTFQQLAIKLLQAYNFKHYDTIKTVDMN